MKLASIFISHRHSYWLSVVIGELEKTPRCLWTFVSPRMVYSELWINSPGPLNPWRLLQNSSKSSCYGVDPTTVRQRLSVVFAFINKNTMTWKTRHIFHVGNDYADYADWFKNQLIIHLNILIIIIHAYLIPMK